MVSKKKKVGGACVVGVRVCVCNAHVSGLIFKEIEIRNAFSKQIIVFTRPSCWQLSSHTIFRSMNSDSKQIRWVTCHELKHKKGACKNWM